MWQLTEYIYDHCLGEFVVGEIWYFDSLEKAKASEEAYDAVLASGEVDVNMHVVLYPLRIESKVLSFKVDSGYVLEER